jgi:hypothetical protein
LEKMKGWVEFQDLEKDDFSALTAEASMVEAF